MRIERIPVLARFNIGKVSLGQKGTPVNAAVQHFYFFPFEFFPQFLTKKMAPAQNILICLLYTSIYTARANLSPLLITGSQIGGQLTTTTEVENFPGFPDGVMGPDLMFLMQQQAEKFGTRFAYEDVKSVVRDEATGLFTVKTSGQNYETRSIIVATGASARYLGIPGEEGLVGHGLTALSLIHIFYLCDCRHTSWLFNFPGGRDRI